MNPDQKQIIKYTEEKVKQCLKRGKAPAHDFDHIKRVVRWAEKIAKAEGADLFITKMGALLHDIGRTIERSKKISHPELSYLILKEWFKESAFDTIAKSEKEKILYCVRYHGNNAADRFFEAIVLRDADKIDSLGKTGIKRTIEYFDGDLEKIKHDCRLKYDILYWIRTKTAKSIVKKGKMIEHTNKYYVGLLKASIE